MAVLEQAEQPLAKWDVAREAQSQFDRSVWWNYVSYDERLCWAGRGLWGLYRHGLLPGVRTLSKAAAIYVHAAGPIETKPLYFIMRRVGYRFSPNSLSAVLSYEPWIVKSGWQNAPRESNKVRRAIERELGLARRLTLSNVLERAQTQVEAELAVYNERLQ